MSDAMEPVTIHLEEDLTEIGKMIWQYLDNKYIIALKEEVKEYRSICESHLGKEAYLIQAIMPFLPQEKQLFEWIMQVILYNSMIDIATMNHQELRNLYRDKNPEKERFKRLVYKLIMVKLLMMLEQLD